MFFYNLDSTNWFSTKWLGSVCRILEAKKNNITNNLGLMQSVKHASGLAPLLLVPRGPLGPLIFPSC